MGGGTGSGGLEGKIFEQERSSEMRLYGFDPESETDQLAWDETAPRNCDEGPTYENDRFEFGSDRAEQ